jgi:YVTN family beta-propeller protein
VLDGGTPLPPDAGRSVTPAWLATAAMLALVTLAASVGPADAAGWTAYVANQGSDTVTPIDVETNAAGDEIAVGSAPTLVAISPDGATAFVTEQLAGAVTPIDVPSGSPAPPVATGAAPTGVAITPDGRTAYVTNQLDATMTPIDIAARAAGSPLLGGVTPTSVAITPDGRTGLVANHSGSTVTPVDIASGTPGVPILVGPGPTAVAVTPDGRTAYVTNELSATVTPIDVATRTSGTPIAVGLRPQGLALTPDGRTAYVANQGDGTVTPVDLATQTPQAAIAVGGGPVGIAVTPDARTAYVTNEFSSTVTPIDVATGVPGPSIAVGESPVGVAITPDPAPTAALSAAVAPAGSPSAFDGSSSSSPIGSIARYDWDFGDGAGATTSAPTTTHVYAATGSYTARLTVTNTAGTSLTQVYTGQTVSRQGAPRATAQAVLTVPEATAPGEPAPVAPPPAPAPAPEPAAPEPQPAEPAAPAPGSASSLTCTRPVVLTGVHPSGARLAVSGIARVEYAGKSVVIARGKRIVARTKIRADGTFQTTIARRPPAGSRRAYTATVAGRRSAARAISRLAIDGQRRVARSLRVRGRLSGAGSSRRRLRAVRQEGCPPSGARVVASARTSRNGAFTLTLPRPAAPRAVDAYHVAVSGIGSASALVLVRHDP